MVLLVPLIAVNPKRLTRQTKVFRVLSLTLVLVIAASNLFALGILIHDLVYAGVKDGRACWSPRCRSGSPTSSSSVWPTGNWTGAVPSPVPRPGGDLPLADFRFPQDEDDDAVEEVADGVERHIGLDAP